MKKCHIIQIYKDDMQTTSARIIFAKLQDEEGNIHEIEWISGPEVTAKDTGVRRYQETDRFKDAWNHAKEGMTVTNSFCIFM